MQKGTHSMVKSPQPQMEIQLWPVDRLVFCARNPRKNDAAVDRMCGSIREFGFKIPVLARSDGEVVDGHLRLKGARKLGITEVPVILCDEWTPQQVKAFRLMVNRSVTWADWDEELLALELQELNAADFDLSLTGFDPGEIDGLLTIPDEEGANATPPVPEHSVSRSGDLWICGKHRVLCGDATWQEDVALLLAERNPRLMVTDPPYGIELDTEWRDRAGLNGCGLAEPSYLKQRTEGRTETTISGDTRADRSEAFALVPSLDVAYVWHASKFTREVLDGLLRIGLTSLAGQNSIPCRPRMWSHEKLFAVSTGKTGDALRTDKTAHVAVRLAQTAAGRLHWRASCGDRETGADGNTEHGVV
jgi:hypothetical protein